VLTDSFEVLSASDPRWDEALVGIEHDFYHRRGYHELAEWNGEGEAFLAVRFGAYSRIAWPFIRRSITGTDLYDVTSVIGYAGPVGSTNSDSVVRDFWRELRQLWVEQGVVSVFTTFHPLLANDRLVSGLQTGNDSPIPAVVSPGRTVSVDLSGSPDERMASYEKETRYEIRRAYRRGLEVRADTDLDHLGDLARLNEETMRRNRAPRRHQFGADYFERMFELLGDHAQLLVATFEGEVVCTLVVVVDGPFGHAQVTGVSDRHFRLSPLTTTVAAAADLAQRRGARWLHLGGGRGAREDSLFDFKRRIGEVLRPYYVGRWVLDVDAYEDLCASAHTDVVANPPQFPAYRRS
jgi:hypothetical protein